MARSDEGRERERDSDTTARLFFGLRIFDRRGCHLFCHRHCHSPGTVERESRGKMADVWSDFVSFLVCDLSPLEDTSLLWRFFCICLPKWIELLLHRFY